MVLVAIAWAQHSEVGVAAKWGAELPNQEPLPWVSGRLSGEPGLLTHLAEMRKCPPILCLRDVRGMQLKQKA